MFSMMSYSSVKMYKFGLILIFAGACLGAPNSRILGGENADVGEIPTIVSLRTASTNRHLCGGSVLNENWILTAAHCIVGYSTSTIIVVSGTTTLNAGGDVSTVSRGVVHPSYSSSYKNNDIALLKLSSPLVFSDLVQPVVLPAADREQGPGLPVLASGWGYTTNAVSVLSNNLQKLSLDLISIEECQANWPGYTIHKSYVCAGGTRGYGVCNGDSGSPLLEAGSNVIVGIVSWGMPCALGKPDIYTRVSSFVDWIAATVQ